MNSGGESNAKSQKENEKFNGSTSKDISYRLRITRFTISNPKKLNGS